MRELPAAGSVVKTAFLIDGFARVLAGGSLVQAERSYGMAQPRFLDDLSFKALRLADFEAYNREVAGRKQVDFSNTDLRGVDFRGVTDVNKLIVRGAYLRDADLRGLDIRSWDMDGCSLYHAKISGAFFPAAISAQELANSVHLGTRIRSAE
jgi:uncharacterized protein YjbI with pentapeptide repeats